MELKTQDRISNAGRAEARQARRWRGEPRKTFGARIGLILLSVAGVAMLGAGPAGAGPAGAPSAEPAAAGPVMPQPQSANQNQDNGRQGRGSRMGRNNNGGRGGYNGGNTGGNTNPNGGPSPVSADDPFAILQQRSIFVKGNQSLVVVPPPPVIIRPPSDNSHRGTRPNLLVFNGVTVVDGKPEAFVEDLQTNAVGTVKIGDGVAGGEVAAISFDDLTYIVDGSVKHVGLGDDFNGNQAFALAPSSTQPIGPGESSSAPGQVIGTGASIPAPVATQSGLSAQDILARMKAKREQEAKQIGTK
jgi:hypothetical protein